MKYKATFLKPGRRRATTPPQSGTVALDAPNSAQHTRKTRPATSRHVGRTARMMALANYVESMAASGKVMSYAEAARRLGVTRGRMGQVMRLLKLSAAVQEGILAGTLRASERGLRLAAPAAEWEAQHRFLCE